MSALNWAWRLGARCREWLESARRMRDKLEQEKLRNKSRAESKAHSLLLNLLNQEQRHEFQTFGHFHVMGGSTGERYRIRVDAFVNIDVLSDDGSVRYLLCARPTGHIPIYDVMAGQLLYLQDAGTEKRFLARANKHPASLFRSVDSEMCDSQGP